MNTVETARANRDTIVIHSRFKDYTVDIRDSLDFLYPLAEIDNAQFVIGKIVYGLYRKYFENTPPR